MQSTKQKFWNVVKPLVLINIALTGIIIFIHAATTKTFHKEENCTTSACKKINADVLNSITVKLM